MPKLEQQEKETPENLRPFLFHRLDVKWTGGPEATTDCLFCGRDKKLYINVETGKWNCRVCDKSGNTVTFLRELYQASVESGSDYTDLANDRRLQPETLERWGLVQSVVDGEWLLPGFSKRGSECVVRTLYRYSSTGKKRSLLVTSGFEHSLIGMQFYDSNKSDIDLIEGPWNVMAWDEYHWKNKKTGGMERLNKTNLLCVPGASTFKEAWTPYFQDKDVITICDSDHPKRSCKNCKKSYSTVSNKVCPLCKSSEGREVAPAGYNGMKKMTQMLKGVARSQQVLVWGSLGCDTNKPSGYDIRDYLTV